MGDNPADRIPSSKSMEIPILECLENGTDRRTKDINNYVAESLGMTEEDRRIPQGKGNTFLFANRVGWGCDSLKRKGLIEKRGYGLWRITANGKNKIKNIIISPVPLSPIPVLPNDEEDEEEYPTDIIKEAYEEYLSKIKKQLLSNILDNDAQWFENFVKELLLKMGYGEFGKVTQKTRDGGIDVIISEDPLELGKIFAQAKRYEDQSVPVGNIREFKQVIKDKGGRGIFVTTSHFTDEAIKEKESLVLIDGNKLADLMIKYNMGISVRENYPVFDIDEKFFIPEDI